MALVTIPADTVTLLVTAGDEFRVENLSLKGIFIKYADSTPSKDGSWGTLPSGDIEINIGINKNLYGYSPVHGARCAVETYTPV